MQQYVLIYATRSGYPDEVVMINKEKPDWQKGMLNLPGGKVEPGETPDVAAMRELYEETGLVVDYNPVQLGAIEGTNSIIYVFSSLVYDKKLQPLSNHIEKPEWFNVPFLVFNDRLIPNLKAIIPLCRLGVSGWIVKDTNSPGTLPGDYTIEVTL